MLFTKTFSKTGYLDTKTADENIKLTTYKTYTHANGYKQSKKKNYLLTALA